MFFGEIVEPTTRALIDDELEEYPEYIEPVVEWEGIREVPEDINNIFVVESQNAIKFVRNALLRIEEPVAGIKNGGIQIYPLGHNNFVVLYNGGQTDILCGQIVETLSEWIKKAKNIYTVTSLSITFYQNNRIGSKPVSLLRCLSNSYENKFICDKLEPPNLITGLGASILSYCIHLGLKKCILYVLYIDNLPWDSVSTRPLINLFKNMGLSVKEHFKGLHTIGSSNLYM